MSENKTEKPTPKRLQDAAKKGQTFKSKDLLTAILLLVGVIYLTTAFSMTEVMSLYTDSLAQQFQTPLRSYLVQAGWILMKIVLPFIAVCVVASALPSLLFTRFQLATEAIKLNWSALNPVNGFKKLFSLRTLKDLAKSILYLLMTVVAVAVFWNNNRSLLYLPLNGQLHDLFHIVPILLRALVLTGLASLVLILILEVFAEQFLFIKDMMMDKEEVKREYKEQEGNPEIKSRRHELHMELLSVQDKADIENSKFVLANPTHIAIGIYFNPEIAAIPFVSLIAANQRALAVRRYAEKAGVPIVRNVPLARTVFRNNKRYSFIALTEIDEIVRILVWLHHVESASWAEITPTPQAAADSSDHDDPSITEPPQQH